MYQEAEDVSIEDRGIKLTQKAISRDILTNSQFTPNQKKTWVERPGTLVDSTAGVALSENGSPGRRNDAASDRRVAARVYPNSVVIRRSHRLP